MPDSKSSRHKPGPTAAAGPMPRSAPKSVTTSVNDSSPSPHTSLPLGCSLSGACVESPADRASSRESGKAHQMPFSQDTSADQYAHLQQVEPRVTNDSKRGAHARTLLETENPRTRPPTSFAEGESWRTRYRCSELGTNCTRPARSGCRARQRGD